MKKTAGKHTFSIPKEVLDVSQTLKKGGFEAYLVGGCVRDLFLEKVPKDWDITTNAVPEQIISLFKKTFYENDYGTVGVVNEETADPTLKVVEVTPYRIESGYSDKRRPDSVSFSKNIEDDLKRRDFTVNAIAYDSEIQKTLDLYGGLADLENKIIRTVGNPNERFAEDGLRVMRAVRLHAELGFSIEENTKEGIRKNAELLSHIAKERVRDEFVRIIMSDRPGQALELCRELGILKYIVPELEKGIGIEQNQAHAFDVWTHLMKTVDHSAKKRFPLQVRLAALLHDISKPETRRQAGEKGDWTFYGHDVVGARVTERILKDLKFSNEIVAQVTKLVRWHMFFSDTEKITLSAVRRLVRNVGRENVWDLMDVRTCDRIGTGRPKESPYRLRKYHSMIDEALRDPISVGMLKTNGARIIEITREKPGPRIGYILHALLEEVLENPSLNTEEKLEEKAKKMALLSDQKLREIGEKGREKKQEEDEKIVKEIRKKHWVE